MAVWSGCECVKLGRGAALELEGSGAGGCVGRSGGVRGETGGRLGEGGLSLGRLSVLIVSAGMVALRRR